MPNSEEIREVEVLTLEEMAKAVGVFLNKLEEVVKRPIKKVYRRGIKIIRKPRPRSSNEFALDET